MMASRKGTTKKSAAGFDWVEWWDHHRALLIYDRSLGQATLQPGRSSSDAARVEARTRAKTILQGFARSDHSLLRAEAFLALGRFSDTELPTLVAPALARPADPASDPTRAVEFSASPDLEYSDRSDLTADQRRRVECGGAIMGLAHLRDARAGELLRTLLDDPDEDLQLRALAAAGISYADSAAASTSLRAHAGYSFARLQADDARATALLALADVEGPRARTYLEQALAEDHSTFRRCHQIAGLARTGLPEVTKTITQRLLERDPFVQCSAILALGGLLDSTGKLDGRRAEDNGHSAATLAPHRLAASTALTSVLDGTGVLRPRCFAAIALGRIGGEDNITALQRVVRDASGQLRASAAIGLALAGSRRSTESLWNLLRDASESDVIRAAGAVALGILRDAATATRQDLRGQLVPGTPDIVRAYVALSLGLLRDARSTSKLHDLAGDRRVDAQVRIYAATALSMIGSRAAFQAMQRVIEAEDYPEMRAVFVRTLGMFPNETPVSYLTDIMSTTEHNYTRECAVHALGHIVNPYDRPIHAEFLCDRPYMLLGRTFTYVRDRL